MSDRQQEDRGASASPELEGHYWDDPVYCYLSRLRRSALIAGDNSEAARLGGEIEEFVGGSMPDERYRELEADARAANRIKRQERKRKAKRPTRHKADTKPVGVNVADMKRRIFNPEVSRENVIKALEGLPPAERRATIAGLPPGLRRKLGTYLHGRR